MPDLVRFGVSLDKSLLKKFDRHLAARKCPTRSKAIENLIREEVIGGEWLDGRSPVAGTLTVVYSHHKRQLVNHLLNVQHDYQPIIISTQHIHLDHDNCLEVIVLKGKSAEVQDLADRIRAAKGVKHAALTMTTNV